MAGRDRKRAPARRSSKRRRTRSRRQLRLVWVVGVVVASVYLYYQPLSSYFVTKRDLSAQRSEVEVLRSTKERLEQRLAVSSSLDATRREARRIGYVRPGERLFIVKGIPDWLKGRRSLGGHG
jgi:cell division protein FtsB